MALTVVDIGAVAIAGIQRGRHLPAGSEAVSLNVTEALVFVIDLAGGRQRSSLEVVAGRGILGKYMVRLHTDFMQAADGSYDACELGRNRRIVDVRVASLAVAYEAINLHTESLLHVGNGAPRADG